MVYSHSGRTDGAGGHNDNIHGGYHYHHGERAHSHSDGCPFDEDNQSFKEVHTYFGAPYWLFISCIVSASLLFLSKKATGGVMRADNTINHFYILFIILVFTTGLYVFITEPSLLNFFFLFLSAFINYLCSMVLVLFFYGVWQNVKNTRLVVYFTKTFGGLNYVHMTGIILWTFIVLMIYFASTYPPKSSSESKESLYEKYDIPEINFDTTLLKKLKEHR